MYTQWRRASVGSPAAQLETFIRHAAGEQGFDLALPANAFLLAQKSTRGWLLRGFRDLGAAFAEAGSLARQGSTDVHVLSSLQGGIVGFDREGHPNW
jgi:hypothetical protein